MKNQNEVNAMFEKLESLNMERTTSTNGKKQLYKFPENMLKVDQKSFRRKIRKITADLCFNIARKNQKFAKIKQINSDSVKDINLFVEHYKKNYLVNDFTLASIREKIENTNEVAIFETALYIVQQHIGTNKK